MKALFFFLAVITTFGASPLWADEDFSVTSYYPSPTASYTRIHIKPQTALPVNNCIAGTMYVNADAGNKLFYCQDGSPTQFVPFPGIWTLTGNDLHLTDSSVPLLKKVGIGTTSPSFKLTLDNDGGILATGDVDSSFTPHLTTSGAGTRMVWYPQRPAFRAGTVDGTQWDDANLPEFSIALGHNNLANGFNSMILGGEDNQLSGGVVPPPGSPFGLPFYDYGSMAIGGKNNSSTTSQLSFLGGGENNAITNSEGTLILGGDGNQSLKTGSGGSMVLGGYHNLLNNTVNASIIGGYNNAITSSSLSYTIGDSAIGGGYFNSLSTGTTANSSSNIITGGRENSITTANIRYSSITGGRQNTINADYGTICGGYLNQVQTAYGTICGGYSNRTTWSFPNVSGGRENIANSTWASVSGGYLNNASNRASSVLGGQQNRASGENSIVIGGSQNTVAGDHSLVFGRNMNLGSSADRTFLWGYSATPLAAAIQTPDAFLIYSGKVGVRTTYPAALLEIKQTSSGPASTDDLLALTSSSAATPGDHFIIKNDGRIGVGVTDIDPGKVMQFANGAYVSNTGQFLPASRREFKENITDLSLEEAVALVDELQPVSFNYKNVPDEPYAGFIVEDVPQVLADKDRKGLAPLDFAALLTKIVQYQQQVLEQQEQRRQDLLRQAQTLDQRLRKPQQ